MAEVAWHHYYSRGKCVSQFCVDRISTFPLFFGLVLGSDYGYFQGNSIVVLV